MHSSTVVRHVLAAAILAALLAGAACRGGTESARSEAAEGEHPSHATSRAVKPESGDPVWHYDGEHGPADWARLSPAFAACGEGRRQSPIDLARPSHDTLPAATTGFPPAELRIAHHAHVADGINNGHTIQINYPGGDTLAVGGVQYELVQYHFHSPSEHTVGGQHFPMEMHMVHRSSDAGLAVVGVFIEEGGHNGAFDPIWTHLPGEQGRETHLASVTVDVDQLLPAARTTYRYSGSLTTPPCSEGVEWIIMTTPIQLSSEQIATFRRLIDRNSRPVQPLHGRQVVTDAMAITSKP